MGVEVHKTCNAGPELGGCGFADGGRAMHPPVAYLNAGGTVGQYSEGNYAAQNRRDARRR